MTTVGIGKRLAAWARATSQLRRPELGFPRSFLESDGVRRLIYGDTWAKLVA
jgi:hypothetical protein